MPPSDASCSECGSHTVVTSIPNPYYPAERLWFCSATHLSSYQQRYSSMQEMHKFAQGDSSADMSKIDRLLGGR
jgi:hypothetical protein